MFYKKTKKPYIYAWKQQEILFVAFIGRLN